MPGDGDDLPERAAALDELRATLQLIRADAVEGTTRQLSGNAWDTFCKSVENGKVVATCVIDFPFADFGKGTLNLAKNPEERLLERMYCFKDLVEDRRVVLHVCNLAIAHK